MQNYQITKRKKRKPLVKPAEYSVIPVMRSASRVADAVIERAFRYVEMIGVTALMTAIARAQYPTVATLVQTAFAIPTIVYLVGPIAIWVFKEGEKTVGHPFEFGLATDLMNMLVGACVTTYLGTFYLANAFEVIISH